MDIQYIIITIVIALSIGYACWKGYSTIKQNLKCKDSGCAGCAFYDKCKKQEKR